LKEILYRDGKSRKFPLFNRWLYIDMGLVYAVFHFPYYQQFGEPMAARWEPSVHQYWLGTCLVVGGLLILYRAVQRMRPLFKVKEGNLYIFDDGLYPGVNDLDSIATVYIDYGPDGLGSRIIVAYTSGRQYEPEYFQNTVTPYELRDFFEKLNIECKLFLNQEQI
jgi:hypothetical protein